MRKNPRWVWSPAGILRLTNRVIASEFPCEVRLFEVVAFAEHALGAVCESLDCSAPDLKTGIRPRDAVIQQLRPVRCKYCLKMFF